MAGHLASGDGVLGPVASTAASHRDTQELRPRARDGKHLLCRA